MNTLLIRVAFAYFLVFALSSNASFAQDMEQNVETIKTFLVDKNATDTTVILFYNMKQNAKKSVMIGQQDPYSGRYGTYTFAGMTDMKATTGKDPLVIGLDFIFITDIQNTPGSWFEDQEKLAIKQAKDSYKKGLAITFTWHFRNPYTYDWFQVETSNASKVATAKKSMASILVGGENHGYYKTVLQKIASVFGKLKDDNGNLIPVLFRPYHEFDGNWFWWGAPYCSAQQFKDNWKFTVSYLRDSLSVHNVLYSFSPDNGFTTEAKYLERYPGDDYVDLVGMDNYSDIESNNISAAASKIKIISDYAKAHNKLAALTEVGYRNTPVPTDIFTKRYLKIMTTYSLELSYMMFWGNSSTGYFVPTPNQPSTPDFLTFVNNSYTLLSGDATPLYRFSEVTGVNSTIEDEGLKIFCYNDSSDKAMCNIDLDNNADIKIELYQSNGILLKTQKLSLQKGTHQVELGLQQHGIFIAKFTINGKNKNTISKSIKIAR